MSANHLAAGTVYRWAGLPGQYETDARIRLEHFTDRGLIATTVLGPAGTAVPSSIPLSELLPAITLGLLVYHSRS